jgi:hypothetical protein
MKGEVATGPEGSAAAPDPTSEALSCRLRDRASALGFSLSGVVDPGSSPRMGYYRSWLDRGLHG